MSTLATDHDTPATGLDDRPGATPDAAPEQPAPADQAPILLGHLAGHVGHQAVAMGLRQGLVEALAARPGATADDLADHLDLDPFSTGVWCRAAVASRVVDRDGSGFRLAPHMDTLLLDDDSPGHVGGVFTVFDEPEVFEDFERRLATGERTWWNETSDHWIAAVSATGRPFYTRLVPDGLTRVPGLAERLADGCRAVDTACGTGTGVVRMAATWPDCEVIGVDGDARSLDVARRRAEDAGVADRVGFLHSPLEEFSLDDPADVVVNNISMHECRDIDAVTARIAAALAPDGVFVISDLPFPESDDGLRTVPGRVMAGIQFFEAQIDDQLLPRSAYDDLLARHGFTDLGAAELTPVHALTWGTAPADIASA